MSSAAGAPSEAFGSLDFVISSFMRVPSLSLRIDRVHQLRHQSGHVTNRTDGACIVHARRTDDTHVTGCAALAPVPADDQAEWLQGLERDLVSDGDADLAGGESIRQQARELGPV